MYSLKWKTRKKCHYYLNIL